MAAAIGSGLPVTEPAGNMIVDIGGGTTDIAVISMAGTVYGKSLRVAGDAMDEAIIQYMRKSCNLHVGERTAQQIKYEVGSAAPLEKPLVMEVKGRHAVEGVPRTVTISDSDVREALSEPLAADRPGGPRLARAHSARALGRHLRSRRRADWWRGAAAESRQAAARRDRPAGPRRREPADVRRHGCRDDAAGHGPSQESCLGVARDKGQGARPQGFKATFSHSSTSF